MSESQTPQQDNEWELGSSASTQDDPLLGCLLIITKILQCPQSAEALTSGLPLEDHKLTPGLFPRAAARANLSSKVLQRPLNEISDFVLPAILILRDNTACVLVKQLNEQRMFVLHPESRHGESEIDIADLAELYSGYTIFLQPEHKFDSRTSDNIIPRPEHWFWDCILKSWPIYSEVLVASFLVNLFAIATPLFVMNVYDRVVPNQAIDTLWVLAIGAFIVFGFDLLMRTLRGYFIDVAGKRADIILSATIFERVMGIKMAARPKSVGAFANNLHEFDAFRDFFTSATLTALIDLPFMFFFILVIYMIGGPLALVPLSVIPFALAASFALQVPLKETIQTLFRYGSQKSATLIESLTGLETIKIAGAESEVQKDWEHSVGFIAKLGLKMRFLSAASVNITNFLQQCATIAVVIYGVYLIIDGELTVGALIACTILTGRALAPLVQIAGALTRYHHARASLDSLNQLMALPVERPQQKNFLTRAPLKGDIKFKDVHFSYPDQTIEALSGINLHIKAGERIGIIGRIGSGKSTLAKLILGLHEPSTGSLLLDNTDSHQIDPANLRRDIGHVPQDIMLFYGSVKHNISLGAKHLDDTDILAAAELAGVTNFVNRHPSGFDLEVGERGENLSGGQRQSIALARALVSSPPILVLDEPSNSMDSSSEELLKSKLEPWLGSKTLLLVTHRASLLSLVNRIVVVDSGKIVADGPKEDVLKALKLGTIKMSPS